MGYDVHFGGEECMEPTYNLTPIFDLALTGGPLPNPELSEGDVVVMRKPTTRPRGLRLLSSKTGAEALPMLNEACKRIADPAMAEAFNNLAPANGWGDLDGAKKVLRSYRVLCEECPANVWEVL